MFSDKGGNRKKKMKTKIQKRCPAPSPEPQRSQEEVNLKVFQTMLTIYQVKLHTLRYNVVELLTVTIYTTSRKGAACSGILPCYWSPASKTCVKVSSAAHFSRI
jgi:hypothetical protein